MRYPAGAVAFMLALVMTLTGCGTVRAPLLSHGTRSGAAPRVDVGLVRAAQLVRAGAGWALAENMLTRTSDAGRTWTAITPPGVAAATIRGVTSLAPGGDGQCRPWPAARSSCS